MKTIGYYISDYGYGHASRSIAVIRELLMRERGVRIIVCHSFAMSFIKRSLPDKRVEFRLVNTDIGYLLKKDSVEPDNEALFNKYKEYVTDFPILIERERRFLQEKNVNLVISDISPLPFEAADLVGIPSIGISNFTWYTAYQGLIDDKELLFLQKVYRKMDYFFSLAGSRELDWGRSETREFGFYARNTNEEVIRKIKHQINPQDDKLIVFFGMGMKVDINVEHLPLWNSPNCIFLVSSNVQIDKENVIQIPSEYTESLNYIAASDLVITKAGWGTISEAVLSNKPILLLDRPIMKEDQNTISYLKQQGLCKTMKWDELEKLCIDENFIKEFKVRWNKRPTLNNDTSDIAKEILSISMIESNQVQVDYIGS